MILSKSSIYGLRAAILLAKKGNCGYTTIREISDELNISFHFLTKVLQELTKSELLESYKGPNGGVKLAKPANKITFRDIIISIDGNHSIPECPLGLPSCGEMAPCPMRQQWIVVKENLKLMISTQTLEDLSARPGCIKPELIADSHN